MLPKYIEVKGKRYKLNTSYKVALKCFDVINDKKISDIERAFAISFMLINEIPNEDFEEIQSLLILYLQCGKSQEEIENLNRYSSGNIDMDFNIDEPYIVASFMSDYSIDLTENDMHYWKFIQLLDGLSPECILNRIRDIRTCDLSDYDSKTKDKILKLRNQIALPVEISEEEQELLDEFEARLSGRYEEWKKQQERR